jgi:prephenate dehydratase
MKLGYLGPEGTFSEEAGKTYDKIIPGKKELVAFATFHDILFAADKGKVNEAIVPIENSIEGTIGVVTDMLVKNVDLKICQELVIPVYHYLLAPKGVKLSDITDIISIPQVLDQCRDYIYKHLPHVTLHLAHSTSSAVQQVATSLDKGHFAAIGTKTAAELYGLKILAGKVNAKENKTRFVVLAKRDHARTGHDKTSIVFAIKRDRPGGLHDALGAFASRKINLTKIESRPSKKSLGDYYFFIDMYGHRTDKLIAAALKDLKAQAGFLKILGSYPRAK